MQAFDFTGTLSIFYLLVCHTGFSMHVTHLVVGLYRVLTVQTRLLYPALCMHLSQPLCVRLISKKQKVTLPFTVVGY